MKDETIHNISENACMLSELRVCSWEKRLLEENSKN